MADTLLAQFTDTNADALPTPVCLKEITVFAREERNVISCGISTFMLS